uniref:Uncharacterized protein n=1 Tax=Terrapene triunguis TaxID=2587831 RepID=A0A674IMS7_9SAUR
VGPPGGLGTEFKSPTSLQTFHTPSLGDEEFEIPPISLDADPSLAVSDVVGHFDDLGDPSSAPDAGFSTQTWITPWAPSTAPTRPSR